MVTVRVKFASVGPRRPGGSRESINTYISVVCAYAPMARSPKLAQTLENLQGANNKTPTSDVLLLLGAFNGHVGSSGAADDMWRGVRKRHGVGACNEAGEKLIEFCAAN